MVDISDEKSETSVPCDLFELEDEINLQDKAEAEALDAEHKRLVEMYSIKDEEMDETDRKARISEMEKLLDKSETWAKIMENQLSQTILLEKAQNGKRKAPPVNRKAKRARVITDDDDDEEVVHQSYFKGQLKDYQIQGVKWLDSLFANGLNGILADEMGLGKTVQIIAMFCNLMEQSYWGQFLVVGPLSTLSNWANEFKKFAPDLPCIVYHGQKQDRFDLQRMLLKKKKKFQIPVILTSYEMIMVDNFFFKKLHYSFIVVDEGHRLKNRKCGLFKALKGLDSENRILLTGTPLQNNLEELWSLLNFLVPKIFNNVDDFISWFSFDITNNRLDKKKIISRQLTEKMVSTIHRVLAPFMLRRIKADVKLDLPPKKEILVYTPLTKEQKNLYVAIKERRLRQYLSDFFEQHGKVLPKGEKLKSVSLMMCARQACCHPFLFSHPLFHEPVDEEKSTEMIPELSGKVKLLEKLLPLLMPQHKVLIFSQFTSMLDILHDFFDYKEWDCVRLDGSVSHEDRTKAIAKFYEDEKTRLFLISTRAGGLGINLTPADTVIIFDSDWNPQVDLQAQDRVHRMGQKNPVTVFRLISQNSFEDRMYERASAKRQLERMVIGSDFSKIEETPGDVLKSLEKLFDEDDAEKIQVLEDNEDVISDAKLEELMEQRAKW